jgi:DUF4097 and DUF4098 domain-containing protein YvlB
MKKFLEDLEVELKKRKMSKEEIKEILEDHKEMIENAKEDGLSEDELAKKFGDPSIVAEELSKDVTHQSKEIKFEQKLNEKHLEGFELFKTFQVLDSVKNVVLNLISEDLVYFTHESDTIELFVKGDFKEDEYVIEVKDDTFHLAHKKSNFKIRFNRQNNLEFGLKMPMNKLNEFDLKVVSGDVELDGVDAKSITLKTTSGDLELFNLNADESIKFSGVSGDIEIENFKARSINVSVVSGDMEMAQVSVDEEININVVSGDVEAHEVHAKDITFNSVSGDFEGKEVYCDTISFKSVSGDLNIKNDNKDHNILVKSKKSLSGEVTIK